MDFIWGIVIIVLGGLAWGGQTLSWFAPVTAAKLGLADAEGSVDGVFWADGRGEALWDALSIWVLVAAGILLVVGHEAWAYLGLIGGGMYIYFGGRGILTRLELRRRDYRIGTPESVRLGLLALGVWAVAGLVTAVAAISDLA